MVKPQGQVHHLNGFRNDPGAAAKTGRDMTDVAIILLDGNGQILAREEPILGDEPVEPLPVVSDEGLALDPDLVGEPLTGFVITATTRPGEGSAAIRSYARQIQSF